MNNDISADFKYINAKKQNNIYAKTSMTDTEIDMHKETHRSSSDFKDSMTFLGNMGHAQVNMNNTSLNKNTSKVIEEYMKNPEYAQMHTEFCDELVKCGYSLEDAVMQTDNVFSILSDKNTYE